MTAYYEGLRGSSIDISRVLSSALPTSIRCPGDEPDGCAWTMATPGTHADTDDAAVLLLRDRGWQVVDGRWTCPEHLPEDRRNLPGAMGRRPNPHCSMCGDDRGGAYGHTDTECTWSPT